MRGYPRAVPKQLTATETAVKSATAITRLELLQAQHDLKVEKDRLSDSAGIAALEAAFVKIARAYAERKGKRLRQIATRSNI